jgi:hypothetical protein
MAAVGRARHPQCKSVADDEKSWQSIEKVEKLVVKGWVERVDANENPRWLPAQKPFTIFFLWNVQLSVSIQWKSHRIFTLRLSTLWQPPISPI